MSKFSVEIAGTKYPWIELMYVRDYRFYDKPIIVTIPEWVAGISGDDAIVIKRDGAKVSEGKIKMTEPYESIVGGAGMKVTGYTNELDSEKNPAAARTYNVDPQTIITNNLNANLSAGTINAYGSSIAMEFGSSDNAKFDRKQVGEETCFVTGWEIYVSPASVVDFKSACGVDRSATVKFKHGELLNEWYKPHLVNIREKVTKVIVLGALAGDYLAYGISGSGDDVMTIEKKNLIDDNTCELAAAVVKADAENDTIDGCFYAINTYEGAAFDVYDTIRVEDARFGVAGDYRIYRIEVRVFAGGEETKIFYTNITHLTANGPRLLDRGSWMLKSGQRVLRDYARVRQSATYRGEGTAFPTTDLIPGDTFYRTDEKLLYTWNGTIWDNPVTRSHDSLTDVSSDDHHPSFTSDNHADIEHLASMLNRALQPYNSDIEFTRVVDSEHNAIHYTVGNITFQDGTTRSITPAANLTALPVGYNYIYFKTDSASLFATATHGDAISAGRGLLAIIIVVSTNDPDKPCAIQPFYAKGLNITADTIAVTLLSAICAHLGNVDVADGDVLLGDDGIQIFGEALKFYDLNEVLRGTFFGSTADRLSISSAYQFYLDVLETKVLSTIFPSGAEIDLGKDGIPFDNVYANNLIGKHVGGVQSFTSKPAASSHPREIIVVRSSDEHKSYVWVSVKNDENVWEWIQLGVST